MMTWEVAPAQPISSEPPNMKNILALTFLTLLASQSWAACTSPAAQAGEVIFNTTTKTMQYCNGTNWVNTGKSEPAATQTGCTSPAAVAGTVHYNSTTGVVQFCNGENWMNTACASDRTLGGPGCTGRPAGTIQYNSTHNELQYCDSTNWVAMGWGCAGSAASQTGLIDWSLATQIQKITASDGTAYNQFGYSVAMTGDTAVIGSYFSEAVYVFTRSGNVWTQQAKLTASDGESGDYFGNKVDISGNTIIIGAIYDDDRGTSSGAAYIFVGSGSTWSQQAKLVPSDGSSMDIFGISVAISNNTAVIGAYFDDDRGNNSGSAYVYTRSGSVWSQQAKLTASDGADSDFFGSWVAIDDNTVVVGSPYDDDTGSTSGSAYVYTRSGSIWTQQAKLTASNGAANDKFGSSVLLSSGTLVIGAPGDNSNNGSAYVFTGAGSSWSQQTNIIPASAYSFGIEAAIYNNVLIIGTDGGEAYIYERNGTIWTEKRKLAESGTTGFGYSVAINNDTALVGTPGTFGIVGDVYIYMPQ